MGAHGVSQAAALALRQLQDQLAAAYTDLAACQEENAGLRADARAIIHAQHAEVVSSEARASRAEEDLETTRGLLGELKTALEATLVDNAKCKAEVAQLAELKLALESCRVALGGAKERHRELEERCAAAASAQRSAEAAAAAAERRAADAVCLRREGSSAAVHAQSQLQSLHRSLQEQKEVVERLGKSNALLEFRCDAAEARADALQADAAEAALKHAQEAASLKERLKEEEGRRKAGEDQALRMDGVLAALRQEATALRLAAEEHAKGVCEMRVTAEAAQRVLDQERGMRDALTSALQHTETTMQRVLSLNQALVESFAEPLILATCQQQLLPDRLSIGNATVGVAASAPERPGLDSPHAEQLRDGPEGGKIQITSAASEAMHVHQQQRCKEHIPQADADASCAQSSCPKCLAERNGNKSAAASRQEPAAQQHTANLDADRCRAMHPVQQQSDPCMDSSRHPHIDEDTLENRILPAIARHMAETRQQQPKEASNILQPKMASGQIQPKQVARVRGTATFTSSGAAAGQRGGTWGTAPTARCSWGVPPARKPTLPSRAPNTRKAGTLGRHAQSSASPSDLLKTREQVEAVVMNLEDELAVLDLRYAELLRQQQHHRQGRNHNSSTNELELEEEAHAAAKVREAMQRKGQQIQQLRQYTAHLKS